jgi:phosphate transport system substrate-binding protein
VELAIEAGARKFPTADAIRSDNEKKFKSKVDPLRNDGWIDAGENDNAIVGTLTKTPGSLGVFGWSYLEENMDKIKGASVNGVKPSAQTISDGSYPLSRSLFIYVKKANIGVTPGLADFVTEFTSDAATGRGGYLQGRGLIPLPPGQHEGQKQAARPTRRRWLARLRKTYFLPSPTYAPRSYGPRRFLLYSVANGSPSPRKEAGAVVAVRRRVIDPKGP